MATLRVNPGHLLAPGQGWHALTAALTASRPPGVEGSNWPSGAATSAVHASVTAARAAFGAKLAATAAGMASAASAFDANEANSAAALELP
jgi:hypothetical protein